MTPLLEQFLSETRELLQSIAENLMQLESDSGPDSPVTMNELFRLVHTLKGCSALFEFPEMTQVLHASEDLLGAVREGRVLYSQALADRLLDAMDFVSLLADEVELMGVTGAGHGDNALYLVEALRQAKAESLADANDYLSTLSNPLDESLIGGDFQAQHLVNAALPADEAYIFEAILQTQREILSLPDSDSWLIGRLTGIAATLDASHRSVGLSEHLPELALALADSLACASAAPLLAWLDAQTAQQHETASKLEPVLESVLTVVKGGEPNVQFGRRAEDAYSAAKTLKVDQEKIDVLMDLIGEMVVAKNSLPYLAVKAETYYGLLELSREIKSQYAVINRIAEDMQDVIMKVRMMPVSFIFQRFPRLVRDTSRKLGKHVNLILEGEQTEIDKTIVEALAAPLIHIVRNSLDHGIEMPDVRSAKGKSKEGKITIRATQESGRIYIDIADDGKGIDPNLIKFKAYEKGIIDEAKLERLTDQEALNLVFAAGLTTVDEISDLSGRGVGMDVVRNAMEKVNGIVSLTSEMGKGTLIRLSLPLSMAVTQVIIVESDKQLFGIPMDKVEEIVRIPRAAIHTIKKRQTTVLRNRIVPLVALNQLLALAAEPLANEDDRFATLVVRINNEYLGILVDDFRDTVGVIVKPMDGIIGGLSGYAGSALLGDGSVLMILNPKELL